jgi:DNA-binding CsgD family transcriptional regulator
MAGVVWSPQFIGRRDELERLEAGLASAAGGRARAFLVAGEAGVGKTRLLEELLSLARRSGAVGLVGGCLDVEEGRLPFGPFIEALRPALRELDPAVRRELLGPGSEDLAGVLPELTGRSRGQSGAGGGLLQARLFELMLGLLGGLGEMSPVVLGLEDLHWSDRSTRDLLAFLIRNLRSEAVLLVGTYRSDELHRGHPLRPFVAELERSRRVERLDLPRFTRGEVAEQISSIRGARPDSMTVDAVFERSEGNAFFAEELLAADTNEGQLSTTLRDVLLTRVDRLPADVQSLLRVAAVGGRVVPDRLLAAVSDVPDVDRLKALREAVRHHLLVADPSVGYAFRHELAREAVYEELLPEERSRLHALYGAALSAHPELACDAETVVGDLAHHWYAAHDLPRALAAAVDAGGAAKRRSGFAEARGYYERALELWDRVPEPEALAGVDRVSVARGAAEAANLAGDHARAAALVRGAIERVDAAEDAALAGILRERLGRFLWAAGDSEAALREYDAAVALVPAQPPSAARARVLAARGQGLMLLARYGASRDCCTEAIAIARAVGARAEEGHALNTLGCDLVYLGDPELAVMHLGESRRVAEEVGDLDDLCRAYLNLSDLLGGPLNRLEDGLAVAMDGAERARRAGMASDYGVSLQSNAAGALLRLGRFAEAAELLHAAERRHPTEMAAIDLHQARARLAVWRGELDEASRQLAHARRLMVKTIDPPYHAPLRAIEAELALWRRRPAEAGEAVAAGLSQLDATDDPWLAAPLLWLGLRAEADAAADAPASPARAGERARAEHAGLELLHRARALLNGHGFVAEATRAHVALCEAEAARLARNGDHEPWEQAAAALASVGHPYQEAYARWRLAETLLGARLPREGEPALRHAYALALEIGSEPIEREVTMLARRARIELPAPGSSPAVEQEAAPAAAEIGLTARQLEVLGLIAAGATNREIAQKLFITEKTAGAHVSAILARLGVRSRVQAATAAHRLGVANALDDGQGAADRELARR